MKILVSQNPNKKLRENNVFTTKKIVSIVGTGGDSDFDREKFEEVNKVVIRVLDGNKEAEKVLLNDAKLACEAKEYPPGRSPTYCAV